MNKYHLDYETFSPVDLKKYGAFKYAEHKDAKILIMAFAKNDEDPISWNAYDGWSVRDGALQLANMLEDVSAPIYAHNAMFEIAITKYLFESTFLLERPCLVRWLCTSVMARIAALPSSLEKVGDALNIDCKKDSKGKALIRKFCVPNKKGDYTLPSDDVESFREFVDYCEQDVRAEREVEKRLAFADIDKRGLRPIWEFDKLMNVRGVPTNRKALHNARKVIKSITGNAVTQFNEITGLSPTQGVKTLEWLKERGYPFGNLQAPSVMEAIENKGWEKDSDTLVALELKQMTSFAAVKKVDAMIACANNDGRVRGTMQFYGAGPGRWSGRLIQPQNFKRPTFKGTDLAYQMIEEGADPEDIEMIFGNPLEVISSCIRHFIHPVNGCHDADYSSIEARLVCWLAGQEDALEEYRQGICRYRSMAAVIFNKHISKVSGDERWMGKQAILGCGYQMGAPRFYTQSLDTAKAFNITGLQVTELLCAKAVKLWRKKHYLVVNLWYNLEETVIQAMRSHNHWHIAKVGGKIAFMVKKLVGRDYLCMRLPSGRIIFYPDIKFDKGEKITYWGQLVGTTSWGRVSLYGGKLLENASQGTAFDLMANGALKAAAAGFNIFMLVHDQAIDERVGDEDRTEEYLAALTDLPEWAEGLPLEAEGKVTPYYVKG